MTSTEEIFLIGGGGHCKSVIDVIEAIPKYNIVGIIDTRENIGKKIFGYKIIGSDSDINQLLKTSKNFHISIGHIKSNALRKNLFHQIKREGGNLPVIISPFARVSKYVRFGEGSIVMHNSMVNANAEIGVNTIINSGAVVEHDVIIGNHCHVAPGAVINGGCHVENDCFIGSQAVVIQDVRIGKSSLVAAGAVIVKSVGDESIMKGNPANQKED